MSLSKVVGLVLKFISTEGINPHVLEWGMHYVKGTQETKTLPEKLKKVTLQQVIRGLIKECTFSPSTMEGHTRWQPYMGNTDWYTHPTMGVIGGFTWKLASYEDAFVLKCEDTWDFNTHLSYKIPLPKGAPIRIIRRALRALGYNWIDTQYDPETGDFEIGVDEQMLAQFNARHAFKTEWELTVPNYLVCDINSPLGEQYREIISRGPRYRKQKLKKLCRPM